MLRAIVGTLVVVLVPGLLVASIFGMRMRELVTWAAVPALSLGTVFVLAEVAMVLHVPFGRRAFVALLIVLVVAAVILAFVRMRQPPDPATADADAPPDHGLHKPFESRVWERVDGALLAIAVAVGGLTWRHGLTGLPMIPPGGDATRHGFFVQRIISGHSISPSKVLTSDAGGAQTVAKYYPFGVHASAAISTMVSSSDVGRILVAYVIVFGAVVLPVGMFVLARTLAPTQPLVAGFTALVVPLLTVFPYFPIGGGDVPWIVAMALVPVAVVLLVRAALAARSWTRPTWTDLTVVVPAALAVMCIAAVHTSEVPLLVFLALLLVLEEAWRRRDVRMLGPAAVRSLVVGASAAVLFAPTLLQFLGGVSERVGLATFAHPSSKDFSPSLHQVLQLQHGAGTARQGFLALLALCGAVLWLIQRRPAWVVGWIAMISLTVIAAASTNSLLDHLTFPWYHLEFRITPNVAFFIPFFGGVALASGAVVMTRLWKHAPAIIASTLVMGAILAGFTGVHSYHANSALVRDDFNPESPTLGTQALVGTTTLDAFEYLHDHTAPGDTVANDLIDGSLWMYAEKRVAPLIGITFGKHDLDLRNRLYLTRHVNLLGRSARVDTIARLHHTRWILYDARALLIARRAFTLQQLQADPHLHPVFHEDRTWIFRIDLGQAPGA